MDINMMYYDVTARKKMISEKKEKIAELLTAATNTTIAMTQDKTYTIGGSKDRIGSIMDKVMDIENEIEQQYEEYILSKVVLISAIGLISTKSRKDIAIEKYIRNQSLNNIAKKHGISQNAVCKSLKSTRIELFDKKFSTTS